MPTERKFRKGPDHNRKMGRPSLFDARASMNTYWEKAQLNWLKAQAKSMGVSPNQLLRDMVTHFAKMPLADFNEILLRLPT